MTVLRSPEEVRTYLAAVRAVDPNRLFPILSQRCPECGSWPPPDDRRHVFASIGGHVWPVVGCSGIPLLHPGPLGLSCWGWQRPYDLLADIPEFGYCGLDGRMVGRRLRVWQTSEGHVTAVISEPLSAVGTSVTNAAEDIHTRITAAYPRFTVRVVEHYPDGDEHFDEVRLNGGSVTWLRLADTDYLAQVATSRPRPPIAEEPA